MLTQSCLMYHAFRPRLGFRVRERPGVSIGKEGEYEFGRDRRTATRGVQSPRAGYACFRPVFRGMGAGVAAGDPVSGALRVVEHPDKRRDRDAGDPGLFVPHTHRTPHGPLRRPGSLQCPHARVDRPVLFIGLLGGSFGGPLFWGFFLGLAASSFAVGVPFVNKWFPPHMQGLVLGIYGMGNIGSAIAAYAAPAVAAFYGWRWAFWAFILPLVAMAALFWFLGRDAPSTGPRPSVTAGISLFRREVMPWVLSLFYFLTFGGFVALGIYLSKLLVDLFGFTPTGAGLRAAGFVVLATLARPVGGWLADRIGGSRTLAIALRCHPRDRP